MESCWIRWDLFGWAAAVHQALLGATGRLPFPKESHLKRFPVSNHQKKERISDQLDDLTLKKKKGHGVNWGRGLLLGQLFGDLLQRAALGLGYAEDDKHQQGEAHGGVEEHDVREADLLWRIESTHPQGHGHSAN